MPNSPPANLSSTPIITTLPTSIIATSSHLDISRSQISSPTSVVLTTSSLYVVLTTNPPLVRVPSPSTSDFIGTHSASNSNRVTSVATSTDPPSAALAKIHSSPIKPPCHFYMQGSCKHGNVAVTAFSLSHQCALNSNYLHSHPIPYTKVILCSYPVLSSPLSNTVK